MKSAPNTPAPKQLLACVIISYLIGTKYDVLKWRLAVNISNNQPWTKDKGWSYSLGVGFGANNPSP
jgi:hypothetical protein